MLTNSWTLRGVVLMGVMGLSVASGEACDRYRQVQRTNYYYVTPPTVHAPSLPAPTPVPILQLAAPGVQTVSVQKLVPAEAVTRRPAIRPGEKVRLPLKFAGVERGQVSLKFGVLKLNCEILEWTNTHAVFAMPVVELDDDVAAQVEVFRSNGSPLREFDITLESAENSLTVIRDQVILSSQPAVISATR